LLRLDEGGLCRRKHLIARSWPFGVEPHKEVRCFGVYLERSVGAFA
jgi:hypothetical protein